MRYGKHTSDGKISIDSSRVFCDALQNRNPLNIVDFEVFLSDCEKLLEGEFKPTSGAINNVRGNWYEWLISVGSLHYYSSHSSTNVLLPLPNVRSLDYMSLYVHDIYKFIEDLRDKTTKEKVSLISSNPDYVIIQKPQDLVLPALNEISTDTILKIDNCYKQLHHKLKFDDLIGFASVKTSLRPDRRLQLSHEGALVKAFYEHLKGRLWQVNAIGVRYYGVAMDVKKSDREGLQTVATHSILSVNTKPEAAVDTVYEIKNGSNLSQFLSEILV